MHLIDWILSSLRAGTVLSEMQFQWHAVVRQVKLKDGHWKDASSVDQMGQLLLAPAYCYYIRILA